VREYGFIMTQDEWSRLSPESRSKINLEYLNTKARIDTLEATVSTLSADNNKLQEYINDMADAQKKVMSEQCPSDEQHCTCVPVLRAALEAQKETK